MDTSKKDPLRVRQSHPTAALSSYTPTPEEASTTALLRPSADTDVPSAIEANQAASAHGLGTPSDPEPKRSYPCGSARPNGRWHQSTIPLSSRHLWAPTHFRLPADHPVAAPLRQVLAVRNLTTLKTTGQQRVAVLVADIGEVLARHTDARGSGPLQTIHKIPFLFQHRTLLASSSSVLLLVHRYWSRVKAEEIRRSNNSVLLTMFLQRPFLEQ